MKKKSADDIVDCQDAKGVWLVKVPRYLSDQWERNRGMGEVGKVFSVGNDNVAFRSSEYVQKFVEIPKEHKFIIGNIHDQTLALFSEDKSHLGADLDIRSGSLKLEGQVVKRAECRPPSSAGYLHMKISQIEKNSQPKRQIQQIDKAAIKFKPVAMHAEDIARDKAKKEGIKSVRLDRDKVVDMLFRAFEKHQYYRLIDLQKVTQQPPAYIKEILNDIATYNTMPPHKSMWELKAEYRHYKNR